MSSGCVGSIGSTPCCSRDHTAGRRQTTPSTPTAVAAPASGTVAPWRLYVATPTHLRAHMGHKPRYVAPPTRARKRPRRPTSSGLQPASRPRVDTNSPATENTPMATFSDIEIGLSQRECSAAPRLGGLQYGALWRRVPLVDVASDKVSRVVDLTSSTSLCFYVALTAAVNGVTVALAHERWRARMPSRVRSASTVKKASDG